MDLFGLSAILINRIIHLYTNIILRILFASYTLLIFVDSAVRIKDTYNLLTLVLKDIRNLYALRSVL